MALSTHTGGAADKAGFFHESIWGIQCILEVLNGAAESIQIETPGDDGAEFCVQRGSVKEHWQAKRQVTGQATWSIESLRHVIGFFFEKFRAGDVCVFASISEVPDLRVLSENAKAAKKADGGLDLFRSQFLDQRRALNFKRLQALVNAAEDEVFEFLCSITIHGGREITLESFIGFNLSVQFQAPWQTSMAVLRDLYLRSVHEKLFAGDIESYLREGKIEKRRFGGADVKDRIAGITNNYVAGQKSRFIRRESIRRSVAADVVNKIRFSESPLDLLITAPAGGGKSACLTQIVEGLQVAGIPVLAFRLDRIEPVPSVIQLGEKLGLGESPACVISEAFSGVPVVLVVDQLDCVSTSSGRHPDFFDTVSALCDEVCGLRSRHRIHLVFACRKFDFEHDHRLKRLISKDQQPILVGELTVEEVQGVLGQEGGDFSRLNPHQQTMLRLPQNLSQYVDAGLVASENQFSTPKELCDAYWMAKRKAVNIDRSDFDSYWVPSITHLTNVMSERQVLSVPLAVMDGYPPEFLERMASEGVLAIDQNRCGFGHETFFDYCFARTQSNSGRGFVEFLENDVQHLFRRAQLRQVLAFLRDEEFSVYLSSVARILGSEKIRPHIKIFAVELLASHPQACDEELQLLMPWIEAELDSRRDNTRNSDKLGARIWDRFFSSRTLFRVADRIGCLESWIRSDNPEVLNLMASYLRWQTGEHAGRVAELLEPFVGNEAWYERLRYMMEQGNLDKERRYFDLFLQLLDSGVLDQAKDRFVSNGTFWSMSYGLAEKRPERCAELAGRWLARQLILVGGDSENQEILRSNLDDHFGVDDLFLSARGAPEVFLENVLPVVIRAAEAYVLDDAEEGFSHDQLWLIRFRDENMGMLEAFPSACEAAMGIVGERNPELLRSFIERLLPCRLYTANSLVVAGYLSNPDAYADEALRLIIAEPGRLHCGFADNSYWLSQQLIQSCSGKCTIQTFRDLELLLLDFVSPYERTKEGFRYRGHAAFNLVSSLDGTRISERARGQLGEWKEKYKWPSGPPVGVRSYFVGSPIEREAAARMSDSQWLRAIEKYDSEEQRFDYSRPDKGGAIELARVLQKFTEEEPDRFAQLALRFPLDVNPRYLASVLEGLRGAVTSSDLKLMVARRVFDLDHYECFRSAMGVLGAFVDVALPQDAIDYIRRASSYLNGGEMELTDGRFGGDILNYGINSIPGFAAGAIHNLISSDARYSSVFFDCIEVMVADSRLPVRSCVASILMAVSYHDDSLARDWTFRLLDADDRLLVTRYVRELIRRGVRDDLEVFRPTIERMLCSPYDEVRGHGGQLSCIARLFHDDANSLSEAALAGDIHSRLGACEVAKSNLLNPQCREWCEAALIRLFYDDSSEVRKKAGGCFWKVWHSPETPLMDYEALIETFLSSAAFADEPTFLLHALEATKFKVPKVVLDVCERFIARCSEEARDIRTSRARDEFTIGKLVFASYAQLQDQALQLRALGVIDQMVIEGLYSANNHLLEFER